jgi:hypothetical protein
MKIALFAGFTPTREPWKDVIPQCRRCAPDSHKCFFFEPRVDLFADDHPAFLEFVNLDEVCGSACECPIPERVNV